MANLALGVSALFQRGMRWLCSRWSPAAAQEGLERQRGHGRAAAGSGSGSGSERRRHTFARKGETNDGEALYGLGNYQLGLLDIEGYELELFRYNPNAIVPMLVSSRGNGVLWDNTSYARFGDLRAHEPVPGVTDAQFFSRAVNTNPVSAVSREPVGGRRPAHRGGRRA